MWVFKLPRLSLTPGDQGGGGLHHHKPCIGPGARIFLQSEGCHGLRFLRHAKGEQRFRRMAPRLRTAKRPRFGDIGGGRAQPFQKCRGIG